MWWNEENAYFKKMAFASKMLYLIKAVLFLLVAEGIRQSDLFKSDVSLTTPTIPVGKLLWVIVLLLLLGHVFNQNERMMPYPVRRTIGILIFVGLVVGIVALFVEDINYLRYAIAAYYGIGALCLVGLLFGFNRFVKFFYFIHDVVCAQIIFLPLFILGALQLPGHIQTWLLYHNALSTNVVVSDILRYARKNKESSGGESNEDLVEQVAELRRVVQRQEQMFSGAGFSLGSGAVLAAEPPSPTETPEPQPEPGRPQQSGRYDRSVSMTGMDVWGSMAFGDTGEFSRDSSTAGTLAREGTSTSSVARSGNQGFSFTQPDTMPPR